MSYRISEIAKPDQFHQSVRFELFSEIIPQEVIEEIVKEEEKEDQRQRKLPAVLVVWICILMHIFSGMGLRSVLMKMVHGKRIMEDEGLEVCANKGSISKARYRLGDKVLKRLFERVCRPIATKETVGAFRYGLRLVAIDSTVETVADTAANEEAFGRQPTAAGFGKSGYPQVRGVYACECGTHVIFDALFGAYRASDVAATLTLLRSIVSGMLVMTDCGLYCFDLVKGLIEREAHFLGRVRCTFRPQPQQRLVDGTYLAWVYPTAPTRRKRGERVWVRVIEYTLDDPHRPHHGKLHRLVTTLLDPLLYPAHELIALYHERWEIEIAIDEIDTHQRLCQTPLRSHKPEGIFQELYGLLLAYFLIRSFMHQAASLTQTDPDHLSFVHAFRLVSAFIPDFQTWHRQHHTRLRRRLLSDLATLRLPPRDNRINPRVVKRKGSKFKTKRPDHFRPPKPKPFADAVVLLPCTAFA